MRKLTLVFLLALVAGFGFQKPATTRFTVTPEVQGMIERIRPDALRGDLSFLASDLLAGRDTPSQGLDIAAEYIASQFRGAGLEPGGDDGYFQTAKMEVLETNAQGFRLVLENGDHRLEATPEEALIQTASAVSLESAPIFKLDVADEAFIEHLTPADVEGKVILEELSRNRAAGYRAAAAKLRGARPALAILIDRAGMVTADPGEGRLIDPAEPPATPRVVLRSEAAARFFASLKPGVSDARATAHVAEPRRTQVNLRNVIGILRGSDPELKSTAEIVSAHYDHLGERPGGEGDRIYNGANDDGSGTVSVIEIARALASLPKHPRRTIVFVTFFGEEKGLIGSRFYARHPAWPIDKTVLQLNLEQVGRTDAAEGPQAGKMSLTGLDYSDFAADLKEAGAIAGVKLNGKSRNDDLYFGASDNLPLAQLGVPAHTLCVAFEFPDYHAVGDEWQKINYDNMAKVDRAAAISLLMVAAADAAPAWDSTNRQAAPFVKAWQDRHK
jgi:hypothetical protein